MSAGTSVERKAVLVLVLLIAAGGLLILAERFWPGEEPSYREVSVAIEGHVMKPGTYRVPYGTTRFEILKVAGVYPNSDLNGVNVYAQAADGEKVEVGRLGKDVSLRSGAEAGADCRVNFFMGQVIITGAGGVKKPERNMGLSEGEKIECGPDGIIEIKLRDGSIIDLKKNSALVLERLYQSDAAGGMTLSFRMPSGRLWAFVGPQPQNARFTFITPHLTAVIKGTELEVAAESGMSRVSVVKGLVSLLREGSAGVVTLTEGQNGTATADPEKGIETGRVTDAGKDGDMAVFNAEKSRLMAENETRRFLYLGIPDFYVLGEMDPSGPRITLSRIDPRMPVGEYIEGVNELGKVYLYGGIGLVSSLVERISGKRIEKYLMQSRTDVVQFIDNMGGISLTLDEASARYLGVSSGPARLDGLRALKYMSPGRDNRVKSIQRQNQVMMSIFTALSEGKIAATAVLAGTVLANARTDMDAAYLNAVFDLYRKRSGWNVDFTDLAAR